MDRISIKTVLLIILSKHFCDFGSAEITVKPNTSEAVVGDRATFNCSTSINNSEIQWFYYHLGSNSDRQLIYGYDLFAPAFKRFQLEKIISTGAFNLVIPSVTLNDAGKYECQDDYGRGKNASADLIVFGSSPVCRSATDINEVVGENNCGIEPDKLLFSCIVQYKGNEVPTMKWRKLGNGRTNGFVLPPKVEKDQIIYDISITGDSVQNRSSFECFAVRGTSTKSSCQLGNLTVISHTVSCASCTCDQQQNTGLIFFIIFIVIPLVIGLIASLAWYCLVYKLTCKRDSGLLMDFTELELLQKSRAKFQNTEQDAIFYYKKYIEAVALITLLLLPFYVGVIALLTKQLLKFIQDKRREKRDENESEKKNEDLDERHKQTPDDISNLNSQKDFEETMPLSNEDSKAETYIYDGPLIENNEVDKLKKENEKLKARNEEKKQRLLKKDETINHLTAKVKELEQFLYSDDGTKYSDKMTLAHTITTAASEKETKAISGLAVLGKSLFILHTEKPEIDVYDSSTYIFQRQITIPNLEEPLDITSCTQMNRLFVIGRINSLNNPSPTVEQPNDSQFIAETDSHLIIEISPNHGSTSDFNPSLNNNPSINRDTTNSITTSNPKITSSLSISKKQDKSLTSNSRKDPDTKLHPRNSHVIRIDLNGINKKSWPSGGDRGRLSVHESNVIVCLGDMLLIHEFSFNGELIRTIRLSPAAGFKFLWHALKVTSIHFVVSHGQLHDELHRVCVVDLGGNVIKECVEWPPSKFLSNPNFKYPVCLLEDGERSILVADRGHRRIILLNSRINYQMKLTDKDGMRNDYHPVRLCFDETGRRLFIAANKLTDPTKGWKRGEVSVFNVR